MIALLISYGADLNLPNEQNLGTLHIALTRPIPNLEIINLLLGLGVAINKNGNEKNIIDDEAVVHGLVQQGMRGVDTYRRLTKTYILQSVIQTMFDREM